MDTLDKILEELGKRVDFRKRLVRYEKKNGTITDVARNQGALEELVVVMKNIDSCMDEAKYTNVPADDGWIPVEKQLPEKGQIVLATVNHSEWISDYGSEYIPSNEWVFHPKSCGVYKAEYVGEGVWRYSDEHSDWIYCDGKLGRDLGVIYNTVTAWQSLPEPYKGE